MFDEAHCLDADGEYFYTEYNLIGDELHFGDELVAGHQGEHEDGEKLAHYDQDNLDQSPL